MNIPNVDVSPTITAHGMELGFLRLFVPPAHLTSNPASDRPLVPPLSVCHQDQVGHYCYPLLLFIVFSAFLFAQAGLEVWRSLD